MLLPLQVKKCIHLIVCNFHTIHITNNNTISCLTTAKNIDNLFYTHMYLFKFRWYIQDCGMGGPGQLSQLARTANSHRTAAGRQVFQFTDGTFVDRANVLAGYFLCWVRVLLGLGCRYCESKNLISINRSVSSSQNN